MKLITGIVLGLMASASFALIPNDAWAAPALTEKQAQFKADVNKARADCLREAVDNKARYDIQQGKIHDFGNVVTAGVCKHLVYANVIKELQDEVASAKKTLKFNEQLIPKGSVNEPKEPVKMTPKPFHTNPAPVLKKRAFFNDTDLVQEEIDRDIAQRVAVGVQDARSCN